LILEARIKREAPGLNPIERSAALVRFVQNVRGNRTAGGSSHSSGGFTSNSTRCGWHGELAKLAEPLIAAMRVDAFEQPYLCVDATGVLVQHAERCRTGHFWVVVAPERHVLFEYTAEHTGDAVDDVLAGYHGYLVADAHTVYDHLYETGDVVEVNCWAHCRRYFFKALSSDPDRAKIALGLVLAAQPCSSGAVVAQRMKEVHLPVAANPQPRVHGSSAQMP
jgi:hypothetical protein